jgi:integrase
MGRVAGCRVRKRAAVDDRKLAREEAAAIAAEIARTQWHGERKGTKSFAGAVASYIEDGQRPRSKGTLRRLEQILRAVGPRVSLADVDQNMIDKVRRAVLRGAPSPSTVKRGVVVPIRAVLNHAFRRGWCDRPTFEVPKEPEGRTRRFLPAEVDRLIPAAAPHLRPLLIFFVCTGARVSEALDLDWSDVDLVGARATFWKTKSGKRRVATMPPRAVAALVELPHREGPVFRWETKRPTKKREGLPKRVTAYADHEREGGGQFKTAWASALRRAGLDSAFTPHDLRHTWASWHYAVHNNLLALQVEGGWSSSRLVERYVHLLPEGHRESIRAFWHQLDTKATGDRASA